MSTKGLTIGLINKYSILNSKKFFGEMDHRIIQYFKHFLDILYLKTVRLVHESQKECQKKVLDLHLQQKKGKNKIKRKGKIKFKGICLKHDNMSFIHRNVVNLYFL